MEKNNSNYICMVHKIICCQRKKDAANIVDGPLNI